MTTIASLLEWGTKALSTHDVPQMEAQILLAYVLNCDRSYLYAWPDKEVPTDKIAEYERLIIRRQQHEPIAYQIGKKEFWSLSFKVTKDTLIPRDNSELLVKTVLDNLPNEFQEIVDVGTGCGVIAITLAHLRPKWQLVGVDISQEALKIAHYNATHLKTKNVKFVQSNWLDNLGDQRFDAIIGNPPYIRSGDVPLIHGEEPFEPSISLTSGPTGYEAFQAILMKSHQCLKPKGLIAFQHGIDQAQILSELLAHSGFSQIQTFNDNAGNARVTIGRLG